MPGMRSHASTTQSLRPVWAGGIESDLARVAGVLMGLSVCLAGGLFGARRWAGALTVPLEATVLVAVATGAALAAAWARVAWLWGRPRGAGVWLHLAALALPTVGLLLLGYGLALPDSGLGAKALFWTLLVGEEAASGWWLARRGRVRRSRRPRPGAAPSLGLLLNGEQLTQRLSRSKAADGGDRLQGSLRADFAPGSRAASIHVAFCPPFAKLPRFELRQSAGPPLRIQLGQLLPHGARVDLKLNDPARETVAVWLEFSAVDQSLDATESRPRLEHGSNAD